MSHLGPGEWRSGGAELGLGVHDGADGLGDPPEQLLVLDGRGERRSSGIVRFTSENRPTIQRGYARFCETGAEGSRFVSR